jgi:hypothetical protein
VTDRIAVLVIDSSFSGKVRQSRYLGLRLQIEGARLGAMDIA